MNLIQVKTPFFLLLAALLVISLAGLANAAEPLATFEEDISALLVHSKDCKCLYAVAGDFFYSSVDGGITWAKKDAPFLLEGDRILRADPRSNLSVFLLGGKQTSRFAPGKLFHTKNAGETWQQLAGGYPDLQITSFVQMQSEPERMFLADAGGKIMASKDGGATWIVIEGSKFQGSQVGSIAAFSGDEKTLYIVATDWNKFCPCGDVYLTKNGGVTWNKIAPVFEAKTGHELIPGIALIHYSQEDPRILWGTEAFLAIRSTDGGANWTELKEGEEARTSARQNVLIDPVNPTSIYIYGKKIWRGVDGGKKWEEIFDPQATISHLDIWRYAGEDRILYSSGKNLYSTPMIKP